MKAKPRVTHPTRGGRPRGLADPFLFSLSLPGEPNIPAFCFIYIKITRC